MKQIDLMTRSKRQIIIDVKMCDHVIISTTKKKISRYTTCILYSRIELFIIGYYRNKSKLSITDGTNLNLKFYFFYYDKL